MELCIEELGFSFQSFHQVFVDKTSEKILMDPATSPLVEQFVVKFHRETSGTSDRLSCYRKLRENHASADGRFIYRTGIGNLT
jgi:hypothetical protein